MRHGLPEPLGGSVREALDRVGGRPSGDRGAGMAALVAAWPSAVGRAVAENAWPARLARDGSLVVHTSSSSWAFELAQLEGMVRERLGELAPARLRFVVGPVPERGRAEASEPRPPGDIPSATAEERAAAAAAAACIESSQVRAAARRAAELALARTRGRQGPTGSSGTLRGA